MTTVEWKGNMAFEATPPSGQTFRMDTHPDLGGTEGPSPMEVLLASAAACSAMDVVTILQKKRQTITSYRVEIEGDRVPQGTWPRPYTAIRMRHIVEGPDLDQAAVAQAVQLSDEKYCSVVATLRANTEVNSTFEIVEPSLA